MSTSSFCNRTWIFTSSSSFWHHPRRSHSHVSKDFPVLGLWFSMGVGGMTVRVSFFGLSSAVSLVSPISFPCTTAFGCCFWRCPSTILFRGWLSQSRIVLLHPFPFVRGFCLLINLWGSFREILLLPVFVLFCWRLLLLIFLFRRAPFMESKHTFHEECPSKQEDEEQQPPAPAAVKSIPLEEQFHHDTIWRCYKARNIPCFNVLVQKEDCASGHYRFGDWKCRTAEPLFSQHRTIWNTKQVPHQGWVDSILLF